MSTAERTIKNLSDQRGALQSKLDEVNEQNRKLIAQNAGMQNEIRKMSAKLTQISNLAKG